MECKTIERFTLSVDVSTLLCQTMLMYNLLYIKKFYIFVCNITLTTMPHQGEIVQEAIRSSGISITRIVEELGITRPTIYRKFKDDTLDANFVKRVGEIIGHDFAQDFTMPEQSTLSFVTQSPKVSVTPRVTLTQPADNDLPRQLLALQTKYIALLEAYNELLLKMYGPK